MACPADICGGNSQFAKRRRSKLTSLRGLPPAKEKSHKKNKSLNHF